MKPHLATTIRGLRPAVLAGVMLVLPWLLLDLSSHRAASMNVLPENAPEVDFLGIIPVSITTSFTESHPYSSVDFSVDGDAVFGFGNHYIEEAVEDSCGFRGIDGVEIWNLGEQLALSAGEHTADFGVKAKMDPVTFEYAPTATCRSVFYGFEWLPPDVESASITLGSAYEESLLAGQVNAYTLRVATVPLDIDIRVAARGQLQPVVRFYDHLGRKVATGRYDAAGKATALTSLPVRSRGEYTITVQDWSLKGSGSYVLTVSKARPLAVNVGEARLMSLPFDGEQTWAVNVTPSDLAGGPVKCAAYATASGPALSFHESLDGAYTADWQGIAEPGVHELTVFATRDGGPYVFGCASAGLHDVIYAGEARTELLFSQAGKPTTHRGHAFYGDYFTRYMPAAAGLSATFRFVPTNDRKMVLELRLGSKLIARAEGREPSFTVTFPRDGVYTLVGQNPAGVASDIRNVGDEKILVDWAPDPAAKGPLRGRIPRAIYGEDRFCPRRPGLFDRGGARCPRGPGKNGLPARRPVRAVVVAGRLAVRCQRGQLQCQLPFAGHLHSGRQAGSLHSGHG